VHRANIGADYGEVKTDPSRATTGPTVRPSKLARRRGDYHGPVTVLSIDDPGDARLADYRGIPDPELARSRGVFVAEGRLVVGRLLASRFITRSVLVTPAALDGLRPHLEARPSVPVFVVAQPVMNLVAGFNIHRGCLAVGERPAPTSWQDLVRGCGASDPPPASLVALERVGNADNVGATFRAAAAFGAGGVLLDDKCVDPLYRKAIRTSMGAALHVPFAADVPWLDALTGVRRQGWAIVGLTPDPTAAPIRNVIADCARQPVVLVLGHEGEGLTPATAAACTHAARIPMTTSVDSLNVAMAAGIALYEWRATVCGLPPTA
jgi:tRNA G18 (ribose-2'-O)-methylase SpoU